MHFNKVSNILITALNHSFTTGMLSTSALITLINKKDKDKIDKKLTANLLNA